LGISWNWYFFALLDVIQYHLYAQLESFGVSQNAYIHLDSIPTITSVTKTDDHVLVFQGYGFGTNISVFFGVIPAKDQRLRNNNQMRVELIHNLKFSLEIQPYPCEKVPILLVREDRLIFRSDYFLYIAC
jgi:hypothetical protein